MKEPVSCIIVSSCSIVGKLPFKSAKSDSASLYLEMPMGVGGTSESGFRDDVVFGLAEHHPDTRPIVGMAQQIPKLIVTEFHSALGSHNVDEFPEAAPVAEFYRSPFSYIPPILPHEHRLPDVKLST